MSVLSIEILELINDEEKTEEIETYCELIDDLVSFMTINAKCIESFDSLTTNDRGTRARSRYSEAQVFYETEHSILVNKLLEYANDEVKASIIELTSRTAS